MKIVHVAHKTNTKRKSIVDVDVFDYGYFLDSGGASLKKFRGLELWLCLQLSPRGLILEFVANGPNEGFWRTEIPSGAQVWDLGVEVPQNLKQNVRLLYEYVSLIVACLTHLWLSFNF